MAAISVEIAKRASTALIVASSHLNRPTHNSVADPRQISPPVTAKGMVRAKALLKRNAVKRTTATWTISAVAMVMAK